MASRARLIVGLGNPGSEYEATRHNVGFRVIDSIAARARVELDQSKHHAVFGQGSWRGNKLILAKPTTFVNRSGRAVQGLARKAGLASNEILVIVDDLNLPVGSIRLRAKGGDGGHNGLEDIIARLGRSDFPRLRIGIGNGFGRGQQSDFVLSEFDDEEKPLIDEAVLRAQEAALAFVSDGIHKAMSWHNRTG